MNDISQNLNYNLFERADPNLLAWMASTCETKSCEAGTALIQEGRTTEHLVIVDSREVAVETSQGRADWTLLRSSLKPKVHCEQKLQMHLRLILHSFLPPERTI